MCPCVFQTQNKTLKESRHLCFSSFLYLQRTVMSYMFVLTTQISQHGVWIFEMWKCKERKNKCYATVFSIFCWHAFKAAHSWTSAVRCWKRLRTAKDILVIKVNQAGTAPLTSKNRSPDVESINLQMTRLYNHQRDWGGKLFIICEVNYCSKTHTDHVFFFTAEHNKRKRKFFIFLDTDCNCLIPRRFQWALSTGGVFYIDKALL